MKIASIGGGPAGLYFAILMKSADPSHDVVVHERNRADDTFGFGVVFSDATLANLRAADAPTHDAIVDAFWHWDDIETHHKGDVVVSTGHGFSGMSRKQLLLILQERAAALGVRIHYERDVTDVDAVARSADLVLAADGVNSTVRARFADRFLPTVDLRPNRFVWLGTTRPFPAFTFWFEKDRHGGLFRVHAYQYKKQQENEGDPISTFIVECTEETWRRAGLDRASEDETIAFCEKLFAGKLEEHRLIKNRSLWRSFPNVSNARWSHRVEGGGRVVLVGDAAHTAHFSIGSGTKLAMEDAIALADAMKKHRDLDLALTSFEGGRRPAVEAVQRAADVSMRWFEETERYFDRFDALQFTFSMLTRSLRITHANLKLRDPALVARVDRAFADRARSQSRHDFPVDPAPPPMFTPFRLRDVVLANRVVVSPMCMYSAVDGTIDDFHLVHLGSRAMGGAGLVMTEMTDVSRQGRITPACAGMYRDEHVVAWKRVVDFVHGKTKAKIGVQLAHAGRKASTCVPWKGGSDTPLPREEAWPIVAPSPLPFLPHSPVPREMTRADMDEVRADFVRAAERADEAGFDLVELHMAHGYLLSSFLSPLTNVRTDDYGGSLTKRLKFPLEIFFAVRAVWPSHKPMSARISATDWKEGGTTPADAVVIARALKEAGCDVIDVSAGSVVADQHAKYGRLFQTPFSDRVRNEAEIATMTVGNVSSWADVNAILAAGRADLCVLARGHLYDPYWTRHAAYEQGVDLEWPVQYRAAKTFTPRG